VGALVKMATTDGIDLNALNYTIKVPYNGSIATGGDSLTADLNIFYDVSYYYHHHHHATKEHHG
jgi:hypothetical protein